MRPRFLYMHGFASGPGSEKGVALARHFASRGVDLALLDGRRPSLPHLRLSAIIDEIGRAIGGPRDRAVLMGSSLGALAAARAAERDARASALVLLAPAFRLMSWWRDYIGAAAWDEWRQTGWFETFDWSTGMPARVDWGFAVDAEAVDAGWPDVRVPTLILHGRRDAVVSVELSRQFAAGKPWIRLIELDDEHDLTASIPRIISECDRFLAPWLGPAGAPGSTRA